MSVLHYRVSAVAARHWLVSCEDVAIQDFETRQAALDAVAGLVDAARARGDWPVLVVRAPTHAAQQAA